MKGVALVEQQAVPSRRHRQHMGEAGAGRLRIPGSQRVTQGEGFGRECPGIVFHLLDQAELDFSFTDPSAFEDLESGEQLPIVPEAAAKQYRDLVQAHVEALRERCSANRIDYTLVNTSSPLDHALFSYLTTRERLSRVR